MIRRSAPDPSEYLRMTIPDSCARVCASLLQPLRPRKVNAEDGASAPRAFKGDRPAHPLNGAACDRETDAQPRVALRRGEALEDLEDALAVFGADADAVVFD